MGRQRLLFATGRHHHLYGALRVARVYAAPAWHLSMEGGLMAASCDGKDGSDRKAEHMRLQLLEHGWDPAPEPLTHV